MDLDTGVVAGGAEGRLTDRERTLLAYLAERSGQAVSRHELLTEIWGYSEHVISRAVDNAVRRLREKIEVDPSEPRHLLTVHGTGYRFLGSQPDVAPVEVSAPRRRRLALGEHCVDLDRAQVEGPAGSQPLSANEVALLEALVAAAGGMVAHDVLARRIGAASRRAVGHALYRLRVKLEAQPDAPRHLVTVRGLGSRLQQSRMAPRPTTSVLVAVQLGGHASTWPREVDGDEIGTLIQWLADACHDLQGEGIADGWQFLFEGDHAAIAFAIRVLDQAPRPVALSLACLRGHPLAWRDVVSGRLMVVGPELHRLRDLIRRAPANTALVDSGLWDAAGEPFERAAVPVGFDAVQLGGEGEADYAPRGLPWVSDRYVPDEALLEAVRAFVVSPARVLALVGPAGVGKSRLALEVCAQVEQAVRVHHVALGEVRSLQGFLDALADSLQIPLQGSDPQSQLGEALRARGATLLWLDDLDRVAEEALPAIEGWLGTAAHLRVLSTARRRPGIRGEHVIEVTPLRAELARILFEDRLGSEGVEGEVDEIVARLDGLPMAIEITAALMRQASVDDLAARLEQRHAVEGRRHSMKAALDVSWELLSAEERCVLTWCSTFRGGFDTIQAEELLSDLPLTQWSIDVVESLVRHSLIRARGGRYVLLHSVRDYAAARLGHDPVQRDLANRQHGRTFARLGSPAALRECRRSPDGEQLRQLSLSAPNLQVALSRAVARGDAEVAEGAAAALQLALDMRGSLATVADALHQAASLRGPRCVEMRIWHARVAAMMGEVAEARSAVTVLVQDCKRAGAEALEAHASLVLGRMVLLQEGIEQARPLFERVIELATGAQPNVVCLAQHQLAVYATPRADRALLETVVERARALGEQRLELSAMCSLANAHGKAGDAEQALLLYRSCLTRAKALGDVSLQARVLCGMGRALVAIDRDRARTAFDESRRQSKEIGDRRRAMSALAGLGSVHADAQDHEAALDAYQQALDVAERIDCFTDQTYFLCNVGICESELGLTDRARANLTKAVDFAERYGPLHVKANACLELGMLEGTDATQRRAALEAGLQPALGVPHVHAALLIRLVELCRDSGAIAAAEAYHARLRQLAEALPRSLVERLSHDEEIGAAWRQLTATA